MVPPMVQYLITNQFKQEERKDEQDSSGRGDTRGGEQVKGVVGNRGTLAVKRWVLPELLQPECDQSKVTKKEEADMGGRAHSGTRIPAGNRNRMVGGIQPDRRVTTPKVQEVTKPFMGL